jgi:hypothetical protein
MILPPRPVIRGTPTIAPARTIAAATPAPMTAAAIGAIGRRGDGPPSRGGDGDRGGAAATGTARARRYGIVALPRIAAADDAARAGGGRGAARGALVSREVVAPRRAERGGAMPDVPLSPHFTLRELCKSHEAVRHGIDNLATDRAVIANLRAVALGILEPVREHFAIAFSPQSGYRGPVLNSVVGGSAKSQHMTGEAVDLELPTVDNVELARWIRSKLDFDQLILEFHRSGEPGSGWVHVSLRRDGANRGQALTTADGRSFARGLVA